MDNRACHICIPVQQQRAYIYNIYIEYSRFVATRRAYNRYSGQDNLDSRLAGREDLPTAKYAIGMQLRAAPVGSS